MKIFQKFFTILKFEFSRVQVHDCPKNSRLGIFSRFTTSQTICSVLFFVIAIYSKDANSSFLFSFLYLLCVCFRDGNMQNLAKEVFLGKNVFCSSIVILF